MALLQRSALSSKSAAASRRAAAPRVAFSSPIVAQLKQVRCQCSPASQIKLDTAPDRNKLLQNGQAISVPKQSVEQRSIKTQVCAVESINALRHLQFALRQSQACSVCRQLLWRPRPCRLHLHTRRVNLSSTPSPPGCCRHELQPADA